MKSQTLAHNTVANAAREWAGAWYEENAKDNALYHHVMKPLFANQADFIAKCWGQFVPVARAALAKSLNDPNIPQHVKDDVYDALLMDKTLPRPGHPVAPLLNALPAHAMTKH